VMHSDSVRINFEALLLDFEKFNDCKLVNQRISLAKTYNSICNKIVQSCVA